MQSGGSGSPTERAPDGVPPGPSIKAQPMPNQKAGRRKAPTLIPSPPVMSPILPEVRGRRLMRLRLKRVQALGESRAPWGPLRERYRAILQVGDNCHLQTPNLITSALLAPTNPSQPHPNN
ncbi:unnamed protein product [Gadus morhua 'NCC']